MKLTTHVRTIRTVDAARLYQQIGKRIRAEREKREMTQQDVGVILGMTRAGVANLELGHQAILLTHVYNLALHWKIPVTRLLP